MHEAARRSSSIRAIQRHLAIIVIAVGDHHCTRLLLHKIRIEDRPRY
jgi:hypothetical protein